MITIVGCGVAGSYLSFLLHQDNVDYIVYDVRERYDYPCGCAVPKEALQICPELKRYIIHEIRRVVIRVEHGEETLTRVHEYGDAVGYIIDKHRFINDIRRKLNIEYKLVKKPQGDLIVDARGPWTEEHYDRVVCVQSYADKNDYPCDTITLHFTTDVPGYFWAFPSANKVNVGYGTTEPQYVMHYMRYFTRKYGIRLTNIQGKIIKIADPRKSVSRKTVRIGEAGGFVVPFTGEGIRPSLESAKTLYSIISESKEPKEIARKFRKHSIIETYTRHHTLYKLLRTVGTARALKLLMDMDSNTLRLLLRGEVGPIHLLHH